MADSGAIRFPLASRITNILNHLDPVTNIEVQHHIQRGPAVTSQHVNQRWPLARGNRSKRIREELPPSQRALLPVELAHQAGEAAPIECAELLRIRLPQPPGPIDIVEGVPDLMTHDVRCGRRPGPYDDLALTIGPSASIPGGAP